VTLDLLATILEALGPVAAIDATLVGPYIARAQGTIVLDRKGAPLYEITEDGIAIITIEGALSKRALTFRDFVWFDGYDRISNAIAKAAKDAEVSAIVLRLDSPGGVAAGLGEMARDARALIDASGKPIVAHCELAASAGYWLASIADEIYVPEDGAAGSIGTYTSHYDMSRALDKAGITITRIQDPEGKTSGDFIRPLDDEGKARLQEVVSMLSATFYEQVGARRKMKPAAVKGLNAKVFYGQSAVEAKLADGVLSWSGVLSRAGVLAQKRKKRMAKEVAALLGLADDASPEDVAKAAAEAKPLLALGRVALGMTSEATAEGARGVLVAWKKDAAEAVTLRADALVSLKATDATERHELLVKLAQVEPPSHVWADPAKTAAGPVTELAEMSTAALRSYVNRRTSSSMPPALRPAVAANAAEPSEAEIKAYAKKHGIKNLEIAKAALVAAERTI
jgi:ClpP class serine protease